MFSQRKLLLGLLLITLAFQKIRAEEEDEEEFGNYPEEVKDESDEDSEDVQPQTESPDQSQITREENTLCKCGVLGKPKIVGGKPVSPHTYPWMAAMLHEGRFRCGGSLINNRYILTAAHCVRNIRASTLTIILGAHNIKKPREESRAYYSVRQSFVHPEWNSRTYRNDIALLELDQPVEYTEYIRPICLPKSADDFIGKNFTVTGWGRTAEGGTLSDVLQEVQVPHVRQPECARYYPQFNIDSNIMICAALKEGGKDSCQGDSGGPLMIPDGDVYRQVGIVSFGVGCARKEKPGVYARVDYYNGFILDHTRDAEYCDPENYDRRTR